MSDLEKATSGADVEASGSTVTNKTSGNDATSGAEDHVPYGTYKKAVTESRNRATENLTLKQQYEEMAEKVKVYEEEKMVKNQEFEKFIGLLKEENAKLKGEIKQRDEKIEGGAKNGAVLQELKKLGFDDTEANRSLVLKTLDFSGVIPDPATGVIVGADQAAKAYYDSFNHLGLFKKASPGVNQNAPNIKTDSVSSDSYLEELRQCKTQIEFDKVRKKYGKY